MAEAVAAKIAAKVLANSLDSKIKTARMITIKFKRTCHKRKKRENCV